MPDTPMPDAMPLEKMTIPQLKKLAKERGYIGYSSRDKKALITMLYKDPTEYQRYKAPIIDPEEAKYAVGDILAVGQAWGFGSKVGFVKVLKITPTGRYKVQFLESVVTHKSKGVSGETFIHKKPSNTLMDKFSTITPDRQSYGYHEDWYIDELYDSTKDYADRYPDHD